MRKNQSSLSLTIAGALASVMLWGAALVGMSLLPDSAEIVGAKVGEPTGALVSRQDMWGQTTFYRDQRVVMRTPGPGANQEIGDC